MTRTTRNDAIEGQGGRDDRSSAQHCDAGMGAMSGPDRQEIEARTQVVSHLLQAHGGGVELVPTTRPDVVRLRFTGLCSACSLRPLTLARIIEPVMSDIDGVNEVEVDGCRISTEGVAALR